MNRSLSLAALLIVSLVVASGCSSQGPRQDTEASSDATSTTSAAASPDSFHGPVIKHCEVHSSSTTIGKVNPDSGQLVDIATFPTDCTGSSNQETRLLFSPDFRKVALDVNVWDNHVKYYDSVQNATIDVTDIVSPPPSGDFGNQERPNHSDPQFDDQGLFVFYDTSSEEFKFFDTTTKQVVRTSKNYVPQLYRTISADPNKLERGEGPKSDNYRVCRPWLWIIDDARYLRAVRDDNNHFLAIDTIPAAGAEPDCQDTTGQRITPPSTEITGAAADPSGSTIVFTTISRNAKQGHNLYRVNPQDPTHPTQIQMSGNILEHTGYDGGQVMSFIGWS